MRLERSTSRDKAYIDAWFDNENDESLEGGFALARNRPQ